MSFNFTFLLFKSFIIWRSTRKLFLNEVSERSGQGSWHAWGQTLNARAMFVFCVKEVTISSHIFLLPVFFYELILYPKITIKLTFHENNIRWQKVWIAQVNVLLVSKFAPCAFERKVLTSSNSFHLRSFWFASYKPGRFLKALKLTRKQQEGNCCSSENHA